MLNLIINILSFGLFLVVLGAIFFLSFYVAIILFGVLLVAYAGLRVWAYLVRKKIINPRPGYPAHDDGVIDVEFTRITEKIEKRD